MKLVRLFSIFITLFLLNFSAVFADPLQEQIKQLLAPPITITSASFEGGKITLVHKNKATVEVIAGKAGGMGDVAPQLPEAMVEHGQELDYNLRLISIVPYIEGAWEGPKIDDLLEQGFLRQGQHFVVKVNSQQETVDVYYGKTTPRAEVVFLRSKVWEQTLGGGNDTNPYHLTEHGQKLLAKRLEAFQPNTDYALDPILEDAVVAFGQAIAEINRRKEGVATILHDYHAQLAAFYSSRMLPLNIGHNLSYQGVLALNENIRREVEEKLKDQDLTPRQLEMAVREAQYEDLGRRLNLPVETVKKYFITYARYNSEDNKYAGVGVITAAALKISQQRTGVATTTVSPRYAQQLRKSYEEILDEIIKSFAVADGSLRWEQILRNIQRFYEKRVGIEIDKDRAAAKGIVVFNQGLPTLQDPKMVIRGILNGLDPADHARSNPLLQKMATNPAEITWLQDRPDINQEITSYLQRMAAEYPQFAQGFNFDFDDLERAKLAKRILRGVILRVFFPDDPELWQDRETPIYFSWGRMVDQKRFEMALASVEGMMKEKVFFIVLAGNPEEDFYRDLIPRFEAAAKKHRRFAFRSDFDPNVMAYAAGADFAPLYSAFEPCGLVQMQAAMMGMIVIAPPHGGFPELDDAVYIYREDPTNPEHTLEEILAAVKKSKKGYFRQEERDRRLLVALSYDSSYREPATQYINLALAAAIRPYLKASKSLHEGELAELAKPLQYLLFELLAENSDYLPHSEAELMAAFGWSEVPEDLVVKRPVEEESVEQRVDRHLALNYATSGQHWPRQSARYYDKSRYARRLRFLVAGFRREITKLEELALKNSATEEVKKVRGRIEGRLVEIIGLLKPAWHAGEGNGDLVEIINTLAGKRQVNLSEMEVESPVSEKLVYNLALLALALEELEADSGAEETGQESFPRRIAVSRDPARLRSESDVNIDAILIDLSAKHRGEIDKLTALLAGIGVEKNTPVNKVIAGIVKERRARVENGRDLQLIDPFLRHLLGKIIAEDQIALADIGDSGLGEMGSFELGEIATAQERAMESFLTAVQDGSDNPQLPAILAAPYPIGLIGIDGQTSKQLIKIPKIERFRPILKGLGK